MYETPDGRIVGSDHPGEKRKVFDSRKEFKEWQTLLLRQAAGQISGLRRQVSFLLHAPDGTVITRYRADFVYIENGQRVVEDVKGRRTAIYLLKKKWMKAEYGIDIHEV